MISKLVTVTCTKDAVAMQRLAESIQKFVEPCEHLVIIEDRQHDIRYWRNLLDKYYTNHNLVIKTYHEMISVRDRDGWSRQQAFKLLASLDCTDKYLILDSKDFFIKPTKLSDWDNFQGSNLIKDIGYSMNNEFLKISLMYSLYFNKPLLEEVFNKTTPFVIDTKYIDKKKIVQQANDLLRIFDPCSEFIFYNYMAYDLISEFKPHRFTSHKVWHKDKPEVIIKKAMEDPDAMVFAFHRTSIEQFTPEQKEIANDWIKSLGLSTLI